MSNHNRPRMSLPGNAPRVPPPVLAPPPVAPPPSAPAPAAALPAEFAALIEQFPLPWVVGPYGDIWVAADVEMFDPEKTASVEKIPGPDGTFWRAACAKPRHVMENPKAAGIAALIVHAVNNLGKA